MWMQPAAKFSPRIIKRWGPEMGLHGVWMQEIPFGNRRDVMGLPDEKRNVALDRGAMGD